MDEVQLFTRDEVNELSLGILFKAVPHLDIKGGYGAKRSDLALAFFVQQKKHPEAVIAVRTSLMEIMLRREAGVVRLGVDGEEIKITREPKKERAKSDTFNPVKLVHKICDEMKGQDRKAVIQACIDKGVNPNTAKTQYYKWVHSLAGRAGKAN